MGDRKGVHARLIRGVLTATAMGLLGACGGGSSETTATPASPAPPSSPQITTYEAYRFLNQATFGATEAEAERVIDLGYEAWIDEQLAMSASLQLPYVQSLPKPNIIQFLNNNRAQIWAKNAITGPDQLRQRVAFALSQIMVVSQFSALQNAPYSLASYYDLLAEHAFGNFRELMQAVTLHPAMGVFLSMLGNEKPNAALNIRPDENFARELMQLFTIGLVELHADGSPRLDGFGQPLPTFTQEVIEGFAHVYTGWNYADAASFQQARRSDANQIVPMQLYPAYHDTGPKKLLNGTVLPGGQQGEQDLTDALDNIFQHDNVAPFVSQRLIERLTASNPSPAYVERVARMFENNGFGIRGDLGAVVKAILLDPEARPAAISSRDGKLKEPVLRLTQLWRAFEAYSVSGIYNPGALETFTGQGPLQAPSVFNFFSPSYAPAGEIRDAGLVAPEMQLATEFQNTNLTNYFWLAVVLWTSANEDSVGDSFLLNENSTLLDINEELDLATDADALLDRVSDKLLGGHISIALRERVLEMLKQIPEEEAASRVAEAMYLIVTSPEYAYQR